MPTDRPRFDEGGDATGSNAGLTGSRIASGFGTTGATGTTGAAETSGSPDEDAVRAALGRLAGASRGSVVDRAEAAVGDLDAAVALVETDGLAELEGAIAATDDPALAARGERALVAYRRFRAAAAGHDVATDRAVETMGEDRDDCRDQPFDDAPEPHPHSGEQECGDPCGEQHTSEQDRGDVRHFHRGRGSHLRRDGEPTAR